MVVYRLFEQSFVSVVTGLRAGWPGFRFPTETIFFFQKKRIHWLWGPPSFLLSGYRVYFPGLKRPELWPRFVWRRGETVPLLPLYAFVALDKDFVFFYVLHFPHFTFHIREVFAFYCGVWYTVSRSVVAVHCAACFVIIYKSGVALLTPFLQIFDILMALGGRL
jgi:hypothetical protein